MKKIYLLSISLCLLAGGFRIQAQCYGTVIFDNAVDAGVVSNCGNSTFTITTAHSNELIMISYNGWNGPGSGPVTVNGNPATHLATANVSNSGSAEVYAYNALTPATYTIVCNETGYNSCYYDNFAAAFYVSGGSCNPINIASLTYTLNTINGPTGGSISDNITTTIPGSMIYCSTEINEGVMTSYPISYTGATFLADEHTQDGIDAADAYEPAPTIGTYTVTSTNSSPNTGGGGLVTILVVIPPTPCAVGGNLSVIPTITNTTCGNCNGVISVTASGGTPPYTYTWTPPISTTSSISSLCAGNYTVSVNDADCHDSTLTVHIASSTGITVTANVVANEPCNGSSVGIAASGVSGGTAPYTYAWSPAGGTNAMASNLSAGTYTISIHDSSGCSGSASVSITQPGVFSITASSIPLDSACAGESIILSATGATSYMWSTGGTTSSVVVIIPAGDTAYYGVKGISGPCSDSIPLKIKVIPTISATISATNDSICPHGTTTITARGSGGQTTYKWSTGATTSSIIVTDDTVTATYTAMVNGLCDSVPVVKTIWVIPLPVLAISGTLSKCKGAKDTLIVSSSINPTKYKWGNGSTSNTYYTGAINGDSTIYVTAENSLGCSIKDSFKITERLYPGGSIRYIPACGMVPTKITVSPTGVGPYTYLWNTGGTNDTIDVFITDTTTYTVVISNGCPTTKTVTVIPDVPTLSACCNATILAGGDTTIITNGPNIIKYAWLPNTGLNCDSCANVIANPTVTTTYTVTGTDADGCTTFTVVTIVVETPCFNFTIPNVFTPSNAGSLGLDNVFYIKTTNLNSWSILIFDRWGKEVFNSSNPTEYWSGKTESGTDVPAGVYYYEINATCQGTNYKKDGYVQLIR